MRTLHVVVLDVLGDRVPQRFLAEEDHPTQALRLDREDEAFGEGVAVRGLLRRQHYLDASVTQDALELSRELRGSVAGQNCRNPS